MSVQPVTSRTHCPVPLPLPFPLPLPPPCTKIYPGKQSPEQSALVEA